MNLLYRSAKGDSSNFMPQPTFARGNLTSRFRKTGELTPA
jgi:hypothetical protein